MNHSTTEPAPLSPASSASVLEEHARSWRSKVLQASVVLAVIIFASWYVDLLNFRLENLCPLTSPMLWTGYRPSSTPWQ
jgi:phosphonate transport system permease protein